MAKERALITTPEDWGAPKESGDSLGQKLGYPGRSFSPYVYYDGETLPDLVPTNSGTAPDSIERSGGEPYFVNGVRGKAQKFRGYTAEYVIFRNWYLPTQMDNEKYMVSVYFTPDSLEPTYQGIATTRGDGYGTDRGFHISTYKNTLNVRGMDGNTVNLYSNDDSITGTPIYLEVGKTYHIVVSVDPTKTNKFEVYVNGELWMASTTHIKPGWNERSITIGNYISSATVSYPAMGTIDEFLFFVGNDSTPTIEEMKAYDNYVRNTLKQGRLLDYHTEPGSIQIMKKDDGTYFTGGAVTWESGVIDIGEPPIDYYGRLQVNALQDVSNHSIVLSTQTSADGVNFNEWQAVGADGTLYSPKLRYYRIRAALSTISNLSTPVLKEIQILEYFEAKKYDLITEPLRVYADLDTGLKPMGILNRAYDEEIEEEIKSSDILTFKLPMNDPKRKALGADAVEYLIRLGNRRYILKENNDKKDGSGKKLSTFKAEAKWYELNDSKIPEYELVEATATQHINKILSNALPSVTWRLGSNLSSKSQKRTIRGTWKSVLALLREVEDTFGVELKFYYDEETDGDIIDVLDSLGVDKKIRFYYNKNIKEIERNIDTYGMVTRLYLYGKGQLDIKTVNGGRDYIENLQWVNKLGLRNKVRPDVYTNENYTIPENLMADGVTMLAEQSKPNISYSMTLQDLSARSGHEPESIELGDTVYPIDEDLMIKHLPSRIMRRKYKIREPHKTEVELDQPKKQLADAQSRSFDDSIQTLTESDPVSSADIQEMTVFNHLLNSRADDGLDEWTYQGTGGITASADGGFSGENSFKIEAAYDQAKSISQEIFNIAHRSTYTISAMVNKEGNITAGAEGFIGLRVRVKYKSVDGKPPKEEVKLLKIPDVTNMKYDGENPDQVDEV